MKFIGFIKEQDDDFFAKSLNEYYLNDNVENIHREDVINYLTKGLLCVSFMGIAEDFDNERMGSLAVLTDGIWYWPEYFINYLKKYPNFKIESEFVTYVLKNKEKEITLSEDENLLLEKKFYMIANFQ